MDCGRFEDGIATLAEGEGSPEAAAHVAGCPACAARLDGLRKVVQAARLPRFEAPADLVARAQGLMQPRPRLVARLLGNGLLGAARAARTDDFALLVGTDDVAVRLNYAKTSGGWELLGRAPGEGWTVVRGNEETPCGPSGRFRLVVRSLDEAMFVLRAPGIEIEVPSARELLDRGI